MSVSAFWYATPIINAFGANPINYLSDTIKVMLTTASYVPTQATDAFKAAVTNEVTGTGYSAGGNTLGSKTLTYNSGTQTITFGGATVTWPTSTITARTLVVYDATPGSDATRPLMIQNTSSMDIISSGGTFQIVWATGGIGTIVLS